MNNILFNTHDIVLAVCILVCIFFAIANNLGKTFSPSSRNVLTVFFVLSACAAFDTLVFWGDAVRYAAFALSPWLLMLFSFAAFAVGPFLYWFFRSLQQPHYRLSTRDYVQLLPALLALPYLYWACLRHPIEQQQALILNLSIFSDTQVHFFAFLTLKKLIPVLYGVKCLALVFGRPGFIAAQPAGLRQLLPLYSCFALLWAWGLGVHVLGQWMPVALSDQLGVVGNYLNLALLVMIWFERSKTAAHTEQTLPPPEPATLVQHSEDFLTGAAPLNSGITNPDGAAPISRANIERETDELAARIHVLMQEARPHLNSQITLERFAALLNVPPRHVSAVINGFFKQNFQEFINGYRISAAKLLLSDPVLADTTVLEIAVQAGFNSKATFNRLFKQQLGVTPSVYRQACLPALRVSSHPFAASQDLHNLN